MEISTPQKIKLLKLMELLRENSDEDHPLKTNVLCTMLKMPGFPVTDEHSAGILPH